MSAMLSTRNARSTATRPEPWQTAAAYSKASTTPPNSSYAPTLQFMSLCTLVALAKANGWSLNQ
eukprot:scaffold253759_cov17-Prasinocladus_malaysianus.AAC.1